MKSIWIIANWKSNKTIAEALDWVNEVGPKVPRQDNLQVVVCPTFSALSEIAKAVKVGGFPMMVGSQDLSPFGVGAYTGEEPAALIKDLIQLAIIGHSERRKQFSETDQMVSQKVKQALESDIKPLICVQGLDTPVPEGTGMIAYEPIWAISTGLDNTPGVGKADTPEDANKIARSLKELYGENVEIIYGGSVNSKNVEGFLKQDNINGVLVGNASLEADEFVKIVQSSLSV